MLFPPYNPTGVNTDGLGCSRFARRYSGNRKNLLPERNGTLAPTPRITPKRDAKASVQKESPIFAFYSSRYWNVLLPEVSICIHRFLPKVGGFPHSDISGSKVVCHLPEAYRRHTTSFIALLSQGIHHTPLRSCKERCTPLYMLCLFVVHRGRKDPNRSSLV